jgi:hypothetical protein
MSYDFGPTDTDEPSDDDYDNWDSDTSREQENLPGGDGYGD